MQNLLVGNGINIQFDYENYTPQAIILRILEELDSPSFPREIIIDPPILLKQYIGKLFLFGRKAIDGAFNNSTISTAEKIALVDFIERYREKRNSLRIADIGFEDYYLIHDLVCHKNGIENPEQYTIRESLKMAYLHSIYNWGKLNLLHKLYSNNFKQFLSGCDCIFSTNYDSNIEYAINKDVFHIHGQFDRLSEVYNPNSFRNQMHDDPLNGISLNPVFSYLHSTAVSTFCGDYKQYQIKQNVLANEVIKKFANSYLDSSETKNNVDSWEKNSNYLISNLADAIKLKVANPDLKFQEDYPIKELSEISGKLIILGLSPNNDYHLFSLIDDATLDECIYYFLNPDECCKVENILPKLTASGKLKFMNVKKFWRDM